MRAYRIFQIKWYHVLLALVGVLLVGFVLLWIFFGDRRIGDFHEEETDIVG